MGKTALFLVLLLSYRSFGEEAFCDKNRVTCGNENPNEKYAEEVNLIKKQFETFPMPEFSEDDLLFEMDWYSKFQNGTIEKSRVLQHASLEPLNHFLFGVTLLSN